MFYMLSQMLFGNDALTAKPLQTGTQMSKKKHNRRSSDPTSTSPGYF